MLNPIKEIFEDSQPNSSIFKPIKVAIIYLFLSKGAVKQKKKV